MRPVDRSMNVDLTQGMVDGKLRCANPDRGGIVEPTTASHRTSLSFNEYGDRGESPSTTTSDERPDVVGFLP